MAQNQSQFNCTVVSYSPHANLSLIWLYNNELNEPSRFPPVQSAQKRSGSVYTRTLQHSVSDPGTYTCVVRSDIHKLTKEAKQFKIGVLIDETSTIRSTPFETEITDDLVTEDEFLSTATSEVYPEVSLRDASATTRTTILPVVLTLVFVVVLTTIALFYVFLRTKRRRAGGAEETIEPVEKEKTPSSSPLPLRRRLPAISVTNANGDNEAIPEEKSEKFIRQQQELQWNSSMFDSNRIDDANVLPEGKKDENVPLGVMEFPRTKITLGHVIGRK